MAVLEVVLDEDTGAVNREAANGEGVDGTRVNGDGGEKVNGHADDMKTSSIGAEGQTNSDGVVVPPISALPGVLTA